MSDAEIAGLLEYFDDLAAPPPPFICDQADVLAEGHRLAEQAAVDNRGKPQANIRDAMAMALYRYWVAIPW